VCPKINPRWQSHEHANSHTFTLWGRWEGRQMSESKDGREHGGDRGRGEDSEKKERGGGGGANDT